MSEAYLPRHTLFHRIFASGWLSRLLSFTLLCGYVYAPHYGYRALTLNAKAIPLAKTFFGMQDKKKRVIFRLQPILDVGT